MIDEYDIRINSCTYVAEERMYGLDVVIIPQHYHYTTKRGIEFDSQTLFMPGKVVRITIEEVPDERTNAA